VGAADLSGVNECKRLITTITTDHAYCESNDANVLSELANEGPFRAALEDAAANVQSGIGS
jgi:hypothetical protein